MSIKDDLKEAKEEIQELKEQSFALDLLRDYKKQNKRQFVVILVILSMWFITIGLFVYYINTTGYEVVTETADTEGEGNAYVGDKCNNGEINYGKGN